jgi:hypothetical protein
VPADPNSGKEGERVVELPRCEEIVGFAEKLIVALTPLMELVSQEFPPFALKVDKAELAKGIVKELMWAKFGRPSRDRADRYGFRVEYKCVNEDGVEAEAGIHAFKEGDKLVMYATSYRVARSMKELKEMFGLTEEGESRGFS